MNTTPTRTRRRSRREIRKAATQQAEARANGTLQPASPTLELEPPKRVRVAIYIRISTDEEHQPFSLEAQEINLRRYISTQPGWELACIYPDEKSGATLERKQLQKALAAAAAGKFDILLVYRVDRLSRSLRGLVDILEQLETAGVAFRSATEPVDTSTPVGKLLVQLLGLFAEFERAMIIDRVINGMERKAARGEWCGGTPPPGYDLDRDTGKLAPRTDEAPVPQKALELYVNDRLGAKAIATRLNEQGHRNKGKPYHADSVLNMLRSRTYLGEVYFRGTWYRAETHHQPLVDPDLFEQAQQILIARGDEHAKRAQVNSDYTLAGLVTCANCGKRYLGTAATGNAYRYRYYTCYTRQRYGTKACPAERLPAEQLELAVLDAMTGIYQQSDLIHQAVTGAAHAAEGMHHTHQAEIDAIDAQLTDLNTRTDRLLTAIENGLNEEDAIGRIAANRQQATQLQQRRDELTELLTHTPTGPTDEQLAAITTAITEAIDEADNNTIKRLFESLVHDVRVTSRAEIIPYFRIPTNLDIESKVRALSGSVRPAGFEPATFRLEVCCSIR